MNKEEFVELFDKYEDEYLCFERIEHKFSRRPDIHAFILLDSLTIKDGHDRDMISAAEHDEIFLDVEIDDILLSVTEGQVIDLIRCGVRLSDFDGFCMFA